MHLSIAGYEKLKMYGFTVHGCMDGGSNFCVYATLALDKRGETLRASFDKAVDAYGYPLCLRADMAFEATFVGQRMLDERGPGSFITGPSTANQVSIFQAAYLAIHGKDILHITSCRLSELVRCSQSCRSESALSCMNTFLLPTVLTSCVRHCSALRTSGTLYGSTLHRTTRVCSSGWSKLVY